MKLKVLITILLSIGIVFTLGASDASAWDDCPFDKTNDEYPGDCPRYVDTDGDGICDRSQPAPEDRVDESAAEDETVEDATDETDEQMTDIEDDDESSNGSTVADSQVIADTTTGTGRNRKGSSPYNFIVPFSISLFLYLISWFIAKSRKLKRYSLQTHNAIWNTVLLITLIPSALFGFYMVLRHTFPEIRIDSFDFLYWHVEGSIVMGTIAILHLIQRLAQYIGQWKITLRSK